MMDDGVNESTFCNPPRQGGNSMVLLYFVVLIKIMILIDVQLEVVVKPNIL